MESHLSEAEVPAKTVLQINVVVDEILSNIIYYSGATSIKAGCTSTNDQVILQFTDNGRPYDPREKADLALILIYFHFSNFLVIPHKHF